MQNFVLCEVQCITVDSVRNLESMGGPLLDCQPSYPPTLLSELNSLNCVKCSEPAQYLLLAVRAVDCNIPTDSCTYLLSCHFCTQIQGKPVFCQQIISVAPSFPYIESSLPASICLFQKQRIIKKCRLTENQTKETET